MNIPDWFVRICGRNDPAPLWQTYLTMRAKGLAYPQIVSTMGLYVP